jgi:HSP20 family protein
MSPINAVGFYGSYSKGIDHEFSPILSYMHELDRHFFHHHFMNCFIPNFDLEEDDSFYYLCGELPGAKAEDITIEPSNDHTLVIYGATHRPSTGHLSRKQDEIGGEHSVSPTQEVGTKFTEEAEVNTSVANDAPGSPSRHLWLPFHHRATGATQTENSVMASPHAGQGNLLSERLVGNFRRMFKFPTPVVEEGIKANLEGGLLTVLIPKKATCKGMDKLRRIPITQGQMRG